MSSNSRLRLGLAAKFNLLTIALIVVAAGGLALFLMRQETATEFARLQQQGRSTLLMVAEMSEYAAYARNRTQLAQILDSAAASPDLSFISVYDTHGELLARQSLSAKRSAFVPVSPERMRNAFEPLVIASPRVSYFASGDIVLAMTIRAGSPSLSLPGESRPADAAAGYVVLGIGLDGLQERLGNFALSAALFALLMIAGGTLITVLVTRRVVAPLRVLTEAAQAVAESDLSRNVQVRTGDEVGVLGTAFNAMTSRLREAREKLEESNRTLERKVVERTEELRRATDRAYHLAQHDALTGLPNRAFLSDRLRGVLATADRHKSRVALLFLDLDNFKRINDSLGHEVGDQLLQVVAERLLSLVPDTGMLARLGGDEFVVLVDDLRRGVELGEVANFAQDVIDLLRQPMTLQGHEVAVTSSIGVALYPDDGSTPAMLLKNADLAMYSVKESGRSDYRFFAASMNARVHERLGLESGLRHAIERGELVLHFQPQFDAKTGELTGAEALMRWNHPERGLIGPSIFIRIAEQTGMIHEFGMWAIETACRQTRAWLTKYGRPGRISVNVSTRQITTSNMVDRIKAVLHDTRLDAHHLELEITETDVVEDPERDIAVLMQIRALGVTLAIDDFGTGYSNLAYLTRLPIHALKIDRTFVTGVGLNRNDEAVVQAIVAMARQLKLRTVAEGVEDIEQGRFLAAIGCDELQGFQPGEPADAAAFERLFLSNGKSPVLGNGGR
jgi:diguanylate cyclase (GGDEF)-like protein